MTRPLDVDRVTFGSAITQAHSGKSDRESRDPNIAHTCHLGDAADATRVTSL